MAHGGGARRRRRVRLRGCGESPTDGEGGERRVEAGGRGDARRGRAWREASGVCTAFPHLEQSQRGAERVSVSAAGETLRLSETDPARRTGPRRAPGRRAARGGVRHILFPRLCFLRPLAAPRPGGPSRARHSHTRHFTLRSRVFRRPERAQPRHLYASLHPSPPRARSLALARPGPRPRLPRCLVTLCHRHSYPRCRARCEGGALPALP